MPIYLEYLLSIPKSLYFCLSTLPFNEAIRLPIIVRYNSKIKSTNGKIILKNNPQLGIVKIGFGNVGIFDKKRSRSILEIYGKIEFENKAVFGHGSKISIGPNGNLKIGDNFTNSAELTIICFKEITLRQNILVSWDTLIMDTDFHSTNNTETHEVFDHEKSVVIGSNVWIGTKSVILKGSSIPDGCIIGANALICKKYTKENCLIAGNPSKICKEKISLNRQ